MERKGWFIVTTTQVSLSKLQFFSAAGTVEFLCEDKYVF